MAWLRPRDIDRLDGDLRAAGFHRGANGEYRLNRSVLTWDSRWLALERPVRRRGVDPLGHDGLVGPWKYVPDAGKLTCRLDLPLEVLAAGPEAAEDDSPRSGVQTVLPWAMATGEGKLPRNWTPPPLEELGLGNGDWIIQHGRFARRIRVVRDERKLLLAVSLLDRLPRDLKKPQRAWLRQTLVDAQDLWRMGRIEMPSDGGAIEVKIDLSGAPLSLVEILVRTGRDILRGIVVWLVGSVDLLAHVALRAVQVCPLRDASR